MFRPYLVAPVACGGHCMGIYRKKYKTKGILCLMDAKNTIKRQLLLSFYLTENTDIIFLLNHL